MSERSRWRVMIEHDLLGPGGFCADSRVLLPQDAMLEAMRRFVARHPSLAPADWRRVTIARVVRAVTGEDIEGVPT